MIKKDYGKRGKVFARHPWCQYFLASQYVEEEPQMVSFQLLRFPTLSPFGASLFLDLGRLWSFEEPEEKGKMWKGLSICLLRMEVIYFWLSSYCRSLTKVKFSTDQVRPALGSGSWLSIDGLLTMLKNLKTALFQTFSTWHRILSALTASYPKNFKKNSKKFSKKNSKKN